jgi:purine-binding chemotaxis protein CheW
MGDQDKIIIELDEAEGEESKANKNTLRVLGFRLGNERYCVDIKQARAVVKAGSITRVPNAPEFITGITNLRGEVISLIDIRYFFGLEAAVKPKDRLVLVTDVTGSPCGIIVDDIDEAIDIETSSIQPPLATLKGKAVEYTKGQVQLGQDILILLDLEKILRCDEIERLRKGE